MRIYIFIMAFLIAICFALQSNPFAEESKEKAKFRYGVIVEMDLFRPDRKEYVPRPPAPPAPPLPPAPAAPAQPSSPSVVISEQPLPPEPEANFTVIGILIVGNDKRIAMIKEDRLTEGKVKNFNEGDSIGEYRIINILKDRVIFEQKGKEMEVTIKREFKEYKSGEIKPPKQPAYPPSRPVPEKRLLR